jgi:hypothetical protein
VGAVVIATRVNHPVEPLSHQATRLTHRSSTTATEEYS